MKALQTRARRVDWLLIVPSVYLLATGLSIQASITNKTTGTPIELELNTQIIAAALGLVATFAIFFLRLLKKRYVPPLLYIISIVLLALVLLIGIEANGAQRWIALGGFQLQPTELIKLALVLVLAQLFNTRDVTVNRFRTLLGSLLLTLIPGALIILQPDLGSAVVLFVVWITILFTSKLKLSRFAFIVLAIMGAVITLIPFMAEYQQERLVSYFNPERDSSGASYNVLQAGIAIGSGGLTGTGIDSGSQSQLNFLPSQHTDFVFAVTAEKLGLLGAMSVIVAFTLIVLRICHLAWWTTNQYERAILVGIATVLFFHIFVNIGMNLGLVPVTGLPLPFLSYGGTFMFITVVMLGIVNIISFDIKQRVRKSLH